MKKFCDNKDKSIIQYVNDGLIEIGLDNDFERLKHFLEEGPDRSIDLYSVILAYIKYSQDLKIELATLKAGGYL